MSMSEYPLSDCGFLITEEIEKYFNNTKNTKEKEYLMDEIVCKREFSGEIIVLQTGENNSPLITKKYKEEDITYLPTEIIINPLKDKLLMEFKTKFKKAGINFPSNFDWKSHIVYIYGTYLG